MERHRYLKRALILLLLLTFLLIEVSKDSSFSVYFRAAQQLLQGENIYETPEDEPEAYLYGPILALFLSPFTFLPERFAHFLWLVFNLLLLVRIWRLLQFFLDFKAFSQVVQRTYLVIVLLLSLRFILYIFDLGQINLFILYCTLESIYLIKTGREWMGSGLMAIAMNIKLLPLSFLPYLIYRRQFRAVGLVVIGLLLTLLLPAVFFGWDTNQTFLASWWQEWVSPRGDWLDERDGTYSLFSLIPTLLMETEGSQELRRHVLDLDPESVLSVLYLSIALLVILTIYFLRTPPFRGWISNVHVFYEVSYLLLASTLIAPFQRKYAFVALLPAYAYVTYFLFLSKRDEERGGINRSDGRYIFVSVFLFVSFALCTLTTDGVVGREVYHIGEFYRVITWGTLALLVALLRCPPQYLPMKVVSRS